MNKIAEKFEQVRDVIRSIRKMKNEKKLQGIVPVILQCHAVDDLAFLMSQTHIIERLSGCALEFRLKVEQENMEIIFK